MGKIRNRIAGVGIAVATLFNETSGHAQTMQELYDNIPDSLHQIFVQYNGHTKMQFDTLRQRDQNPAAYCNEDNQMVTQRYLALVTTDTQGEPVVTKAESGEVAIKEFEKSGQSYGLLLAGDGTVARVYMKDDKGVVFVARPNAAKPMGESAQIAQECFSTTAHNAQDITFDATKLPNSEQFIPYLERFETPDIGFKAKKWEMKGLAAGQMRPGVVCLDTDTNKKSITTIYYDKTIGELRQIGVKSSVDAYKIMDRGATWSIGFDNETSNPVYMMVKDDAGRLLVKNDVPGFYGKEKVDLKIIEENGKKRVEEKRTATPSLPGLCPDGQTR